MEIVRENINEAIKHLSGNTEEDVIKEYFDISDDHFDRFMYDGFDGLSEIVNFKKNEQTIKSEFKKAFEKSLNKIFDEYV